MIDWHPAETAPKDRDILVASEDGQEGIPGRWRDGSENYWKLVGWYEISGDVGWYKPLQFRWWTEIPRCKVPTQSATKSEV